MFRQAIYVFLWITTILLLVTKNAEGQSRGFDNSPQPLTFGMDFGAMIQNALSAATGGAVGPQKDGNSPLNANTLLGAANGVITNLMGSSLPNLVQALQNLFLKIIYTGGSTILTVLNTATSGVFSRSCGPNGFNLGSFINTLTSGLLGGSDRVNVNSYSLSDLANSVPPTTSPDLSSLLGVVPGGIGRLLNAASTALANLMNSGFRQGSNNNPNNNPSSTGTGPGNNANPNTIPGSPDSKKGGSVNDFMNALKNAFGR